MPITERFRLSKWRKTFVLALSLALFLVLLVYLHYVVKDFSGHDFILLQEKNENKN
jgi:hypothetical protein